MTDKLPEWVMVPREPTEAMLEAGWNAPASTRYLESTRAAWTAMLAAAPPREVVVDEAMVDRGWDGLTEHRGTFEGEQPITRDDIRAALTAALTPPQGDNDNGR